MMKVTLTMPRDIGGRLRRMCHARGMTASELVAAWISEHDDNGVLIAPSVPRSDSRWQRFIDEYLKKAGR